MGDGFSFSIHGTVLDPNIQGLAKAIWNARNQLKGRVTNLINETLSGFFNNDGNDPLQQNIPVPTAAEILYVGCISTIGRQIGYPQYNRDGITLLDICNIIQDTVNRAMVCNCGNCYNFINRRIAMGTCIKDRLNTLLVLEQEIRSTTPAQILSSTALGEANRGLLFL
ncbi:hypothetical protein H072_9068 [Dactylellina haptotyla CBS 200.50]|uniref:Uncharacterized protein n=1 Tax=Dactylellina haptotyla (strain CBS 200.50) TaxID=1284197 RepID=S8A3I9_DACHA|nr:hypothetical protein H072_9068 [Dactylellina haptotyla CBS 200.50]